jgi:hypothetical protein
VGSNAVASQKPRLVRDFGGPAPESLLTVLDLGQGLIEMYVDACPELVCELTGVPQEFRAREWEPFDPHVDLDTTVTFTVVLLIRTLVVLQSVQVMLGECHIVGEHGTNADIFGRLS